MLWGIYIFPWWTSDIFGETKFIAKVFTFIEIHQLAISEDFVRKIWFFAYSLRELLISFIYTFAIVYWIFCLFHDKCEKAILLAGKAICYDFLIIFPYACIEVCYLLGADWAKEILSVVNPLLYDVASAHNWWPPLLWENQMRNLFAEPSFFGAWLAIIMPILWYYLIFRKEKILFGVIICFISYCMVFFTVARTALCLAIGEISLLIIISFWIWNKLIIKKTLMICSCFILAFSTILLFNSYKENSNSKIENYITNNVSSNIINYVENNALNVTSPKARSNQARYSNMLAHIKSGMYSPILGLSSTLVKAYLPYYFPPESFNNYEISNWINLQHKQGFLSNPIPSLSEYPVRFAEKGILGLLIYLFPFLIGIYRLSYVLYRYKKAKQVILPLCLWISFTGGCVLGFSVPLNLFGFWIIFGMVFCCGQYFSTTNELINSDLGNISRRDKATLNN